MSTTPPIVTKLVALLVAVAGPVLAFTDPSGKLSTPDVQAAIVLAGILAGAVIFVVHLVLENGLTKVGLTKTVSEEEAWVRDHAAELKSTFEAAKPALDAIPGVPGALAAVTADVATLKAAVPAPDADAIEAAVKAIVPTLVIPQVLAPTQAPEPVADPPAAPVAADPAVAGQTA